MEEKTPIETGQELATLRQQVAELEQQVAMLEQTKNTLSQTEEHLRASQHMLQLIIDSLPQAVFWKNTDSVYQGCNQSFASAAGVGTPERIVGKTDYDLAWKTEEADFFRQVDRQVMESNTPQYRIVEPQLQADGKQAWLETNKIPLHDKTGQVIGILGTFEDITVRKHIEEKLLNSEERFRKLSQAVATTILIYQGTSFCYANPAAEELTGYTNEELLSMDFWDLVHPDFQELVKQRAAARQRGEPVPSRYEIMIVTKQGENRWIDMSPVLAHFDGKPSIIITAFDASDRRRAELLQAQIIETQRETLRELSTPLIPLAKGVIALPLVGNIDTARAQHIMECLLQGVADHQADSVLLDLTGVPLIDTQVAQVLLQSVKAVKLLGAHVILTGISPSLAQTIVLLGVDLSGVVTFSTLQKGIEYVVKR